MMDIAEIRDRRDAAAEKIGAIVQTLINETGLGVDVIEVKPVPLNKYQENGIITHPLIVGISIKMARI